ncbi:MAG TPA: trypsin-like peptidase domain-containing protein [Gammaproteobacteria bacterium]|nr:trypsin-like peptidase domain-containing protein [Chromatiaceae bacterium]HPQ25320.1 trypsin-like peptidase domain-containing protein [Gammaproteobacteria bacterium]
MKWYRAFSFLFTSIATGLAAAFLVLLLRPDFAGRETATPPPPVLLDRTGGPVSYADAVQRAAPSVVNVFATKITREKTPALFDDPVFRRFFGDQASRPRFKRENSLGSGVIVDSNGYILTNNHVIEASSEIQVVLGDGRSLPARIVGSDPETDIAVLQAAGSGLAVASLATSDDMQVGDVVMAIGNPFGVGQAVTMGIVSATGRNQLGITEFENFIQTDAAINPGNSGGALINALGQVVGINTAIFSQSGGSHGIGFAIPIVLATDVMAQIIEHGRVIRGWLGITGQDLTPALAESLSMEYREGILVSGVLQDGPADKAGLKPGDIIVSLDRHRIHGSQQMLKTIAGKAPGSPMSVSVYRDDAEVEQVAIVGERPPISERR